MTTRKHVFADIEALRRKEAGEEWRAKEHRELLEAFGAPVDLGDGFRWKIVRREVGTFRVRDTLVVGDPCFLGPEHDGAEAELVHAEELDVRLRCFLPARVGSWRVLVLERLPRDIEGTVTDLFVVHEEATARKRGRMRVELPFWLAVETASMAVVDARHRARNHLDDKSFEPPLFRTFKGGCITPTYYGDGAYPAIVEYEEDRETGHLLVVGVHVRFLPLEPLDPPEGEEEECDIEGATGSYGTSCCDCQPRAPETAPPSGRGRR
jgi:hypothetical protein